MVTLDQSLFDEKAIAPETHALNAEIIAKLNAAPDQWSVPPETIRRLRAQGRGAFPLAAKSERAETIMIDGPAGDIPLRVIPALGDAKGIYLHIHGGGWMFGAADQQDNLLEQIANNTGLTVVSIEYRLSPEHPFPAAPDDCYAAALWLIENSQKYFRCDPVAIGGESAGAHLSLLTLVRLRDEEKHVPFKGMNLIAGCFDLSVSPSMAHFGEERLVLRTTDMVNFVKYFVPDTFSLKDPKVSPLYADMAGLPPALVSIGTKDGLLDDSLFLTSRLIAAGVPVTLEVFPGGAHVFQAFDIPLAHESLAKVDSFLLSLLS